MNKLLVIFMVISIFSLVCCGPSEESSTQPVEITEHQEHVNEVKDREEETRKTARASVKSVQEIARLGYHGKIWKVQIDSIEYILGTMRHEAPITVIDKHLIK